MFPHKQTWMDFLKFHWHKQHNFTGLILSSVSSYQNNFLYFNFKFLCNHSRNLMYLICVYWVYLFLNLISKLKISTDLGPVRATLRRKKNLKYGGNSGNLRFFGGFLLIPWLLPQIWRNITKLLFILLQ